MTDGFRRLISNFFVRLVRETLTLSVVFRPGDQRAPQTYKLVGAKRGESRHASGDFIHAPRLNIVHHSIMKIGPICLINQP